MPGGSKWWPFASAVEDASVEDFFDDVLALSKKAEKMPPDFLVAPRPASCCCCIFTCEVP
jgi:hypothetical protein